VAAGGSVRESGAYFFPGFLTGSYITFFVTIVGVARLIYRLKFMFCTALYLFFCFAESRSLLFEFNRRVSLSELLEGKTISTPASYKEISGFKSLCPEIGYLD
jgi:hypothetical protein